MAWENPNNDQRPVRDAGEPKDVGGGVTATVRSEDSLEKDEAMEVFRLIVLPDPNKVGMGYAEIAWRPDIFQLYRAAGQLKDVANGLREHADMLDKIHEEWEKSNKE